MQIITFDPSKKEAGFKVFSPTYAGDGVDRAAIHSFSFDFDEHRKYLKETTVRRFRQGQNGYNSTKDTYIGSDKSTVAAPGESYGAKTDIRVDGKLSEEQGLLGFGKLKGQFPKGTTIKKAILTITTEGECSDSDSGASFFRMKVPWKKSSTWNSLGGGVDASERSAESDFSTAGLVSTKGTRSFDVTTSVKACMGGETNYGWVMINSGETNDVLWSFRSSEWKAIAERPRTPHAHRRVLSEGCIPLDPCPRLPFESHLGEPSANGPCEPQQGSCQPGELICHRNLSTWMASRSSCGASPGIVSSPWPPEPASCNDSPGQKHRRMRWPQISD